MSGPQVLANVPAGVAYGVVTAHVTSFMGDGADSESSDGIPDEKPLKGNIVFTPTVSTMRWPTLSPPRIAIMEDVKCPVLDGDLYPPGTTVGNMAQVMPGVAMVASEQPDAQPNHVQYRVKFELEGVRSQPASIIIDLPDSGTVDLATVIPSGPEPGVVTVVSTESVEAAEAAALRAEAAADRAEQVEAEGVPGPGVAAGGSTGQVLVKESATDFDTGWESLPNFLVAPASPSLGDVLTWSGSAWVADTPAAGGDTLPVGSSSGDVLTWDGADWAAEPIPSQLPSGGSTGQVLAKQSSGVGWDSLPASIPPPGSPSAGEVLTYSGSAWVADTIPPQLPAGGSNGQMLVKDGSVDYATKWQAIPSLDFVPLPSGASSGDVLVFDGTGWEPSDVLGDIGTILDGILNGD